MAFAFVVGWSWRLVLLLALDILHLGIIVLLVWWGDMPEWLYAGKMALTLLIVPFQIICGGLCPIVWVQQCIALGQAEWFTQPFVYKLVAAVCPWEVSELVVSMGVTGGAGVIMGVTMLKSLRGG